MDVAKKMVQAAHELVFRIVHGRWLIYNACWEDPRIDRQLLHLDPNSRLVMLTSAGCNVLDYLLDSPAEIHTVDVNPRQNALLYLKLALIERGNFDDLFALFGLGSHPAFRVIYQTVKSRLPPYAEAFWDNSIHYFDSAGVKGSFYYHGGCGEVAWLMKQYLLRAKKAVVQPLFELLEAQTLEEQRTIYAQIESRLWDTFTSWLVRHPLVLSLVGVPRAQLRLIEERYPSGLKMYVGTKLKHVLTEIFIRENYFWRVYLTGSYALSCCPNYLKKEHLPLLQKNLDRVHIYTCTLAEFLRRYPGSYTHFVLLDHQDWLAWNDPAALQEEWQLILQNSQPGSKILLRSASAELHFLPTSSRSCLRFFPERTVPLHQQDRVGTYESLHFAEVQ